MYRIWGIACTVRKPSSMTTLASSLACSDRFSVFISPQIIKKKWSGHPRQGRKKLFITSQTKFKIWALDYTAELSTQPRVLMVRQLTIVVRFVQKFYRWFLAKYLSQEIISERGRRPPMRYFVWLLVPWQGQKEL